MMANIVMARMKDVIAVEIMEGASNVLGIIPQCVLSRIAQKIIVVSQTTIAGNGVEVSDCAITLTGLHSNPKKVRPINFLNLQYTLDYIVVVLWNSSMMFVT